MPIHALSCRAVQCGFALGARLLPWRSPTVLSGAGSLMRLPDVFSREGASRPLVVASRRQCADEHFLALRAALEGRGVRLSVFSGVEPNPSVGTVERIAAQYRAGGCAADRPPSHLHKCLTSPLLTFLAMPALSCYNTMYEIL